MKDLLAAAILLAATPAVAAPRIVDSIGARDSDVRVHTYPSNPIVWVPEVSFFVDTDAEGYAPEDVVLVEWREGKKAVGKPFPCAASAAVDTVAYFSCRPPQDAGISRAGAFSVALAYQKPLAGKTFDLGELRFKAVEIAQGAMNRPRISFADDRDHQLGVVTLDEHRGGASSPAEQLMTALRIDKRLETGPNEIAIRFWTKFDRSGPNGITMTCLLGDRRVATAENSGSGGSASYWTYDKRQQVSVDYRQQVFRFLTLRTGKRTDDADGGFYLGDHPGDYRCVAMADGEVLREIHFTVGADGEIAGTACDREASLLRHVHVVRATDGTIANLPYDRKAGKAAGFFGRVAWPAGCPPR
jgi:hypothetical protein